MKIEFGWRGEVVLALVIAAVSGAVFGGFFNSGRSYGTELNLLRNDLTVRNGSIISARSLQGEIGESSFGFPPDLYVWEWVDFNVYVSGVSGTLAINFTRNGEVLREALVHDSAQLVLSGYGEYRWARSQFDVELRAVGADVTIGSLFIDASTGVKHYNPLVSAFGFTFSVGLIMLPFVWRRRVNDLERENHNP